MAFAKSSSFKYGVIFLCLILGTWCGFYLQRFSAAASIFANVVDFTIDINEMNFVMFRVAFMFALKLNLGTLLGGIVGIWTVR